MTDLLLLFVFPALMAYAAMSDMLTMTIPNRVSIALVGGFALVAILGGVPLPTVAIHVLAGFLVLVMTFGMFAAGWIGGGDAKLAAATALWLGFGGLLEYAVISAVAGGVLTVVLLSLRNYPLPAFAASWEWSRRLHNARTGVPYGLALA
ncbi:MAG: peptidase, partial [Rhizobiales bacterium 65-9]